MRRTYKYRIYPNKKQRNNLLNQFNICKQVYNNFIESSINTYESSKKTLNKFDFNKQLSGKHKEVHSQALQNVSDRACKAFQNFFRRAKDKKCKEKGFPRFKSRVKSITYPQFGFKLSKNRLYASKIGYIPIILHRMPEGKIKTLTIKVNHANQWHASLSCEIENPKTIHQSKESVGIDVGIESFAALSNGETISNPRYLIKSENKLKFLQRKLSKKKKASKNRFKTRIKIARQHINIANQRTDFLHKLSYKIAKAYSFIAVENLNVKGMVQNHHLAKHINDSSWNTFISLLSYKAVASGGQLVKVNPRRTSKTCSSCGNIIEMPLSKREFNCTNCGFACNRDVNAARNIIRVGLDEPEFKPAGDSVRPSMKAVVCESGTICRAFKLRTSAGSSTI